MHSISGVIVLNNDLYQHKKTAMTNNRINSKIKLEPHTIQNDSSPLRWDRWDGIFGYLTSHEAYYDDQDQL